MDFRGRSTLLIRLIPYCDDYSIFLAWLLLGLEHCRAGHMGLGSHTALSGGCDEPEIVMSGVFTLAKAHLPFVLVVCDATRKHLSPQPLLCHQRNVKEISGSP